MGRSSPIKMNKQRRTLIGFAFASAFAGVVLIAVAVHAFTRPDAVAPAPVRLVITGPAGQPFSGTFTADGVTNAVTAIAPATLSVTGNDVSFELKRRGGTGEFRVDMYVRDVQRTSATSDTRPGVRGQFRQTSTGHSVWAAGF